MRKRLPPRPSTPARTASARPGGRLPPAARREAILRAALPLFAQRGWLGTGTRELAAAAGVTEPILYRHFPDKEALFLAVLKGAGAALEEVLTRHAASARGARGRVEAMANGLGEVLDRRLSELRVLSGAAAALEHPPVAQAARQHLGSLADLLTRLLSGPGLAPDVDAEAAGGLLLEVGLGAALLWPLGVPVTLRPDFRRNAVALLLRAFAA